MKQGRIRRFFLSERNIMTAILLNALVMFFIYFPSLGDVKFLIVLDGAFLVFFCIEAGVKIQTFKWKHYIASKWNQFDFLIVMMSAPSLMENFLDMPNASLLLILRMFRLIRLMRFLRFVPHITQIMAGLGRALKSSVFIMLMLLFFNFLFALVTCHLFRDLAPEYFGNPLLSAYSIFQMFTLEGWNSIPELISERAGNDLIDGLARFYFVVLVLFGGIFGLSLANAIFVDEMTIDNNKGLEEKVDALQRQIEELHHTIKNQKQ
jgi:voltage-gated sodium channel